MLIAVLSGVRGSSPALEAALAAIELMQPARTLVLGDAGEGPDQLAVAARLETLAARSPAFEWHRTLPGERRTLLKTEHHQLDLLGGEPDEEAAAEPGHALIVAGVERAYVVAREGGVLISPGSLGAAPGGDPRASIALVLLEAEPELRAWIERVPYELGPVIAGAARELAPHRPGKKAARRFLRSLLGKDAGSLEPLQASDSGVDAVVKLLAPRIRDVYRRATEKAALDAVEGVHQIRVATRRLRAALSLASGLMPQADSKRARERLSVLASHLGARRAADVLAEHLAQIPVESDAQAAVLDRMKALAAARQRRTSRQLQRRFPREVLILEGAELVAAMMRPLPSAPPLWAAFRKELERRADRVRAVVRSIEDPADDHGHHELRIALKRLRYTCELASAPFEELGALELGQQIRVLQDALGELHDRVELLDLLESRRVRRKAPLAGVQELGARLRHERDALYDVAARQVRSVAPSLLSCLELSLERLAGR